MPRWLEELSSFERLALVDMSYSRISTYEMCHLKYFFQYVTKMPTVYGPPAQLGNVVHDVLEKNVGHELDVDVMLQDYDVFRHDHDPNHEIPWELWGEGGQMLIEYVDRHGHEIFNVVGAEIPFEIVIGNALVRGYIDRVDRIDETTLKICDYKTGKYPITKKAAPFNLQLRIYVLACAMLYPDTETFETELYYLRNGSTRGHTFTRADLADLEQSVVKAIWEIVDDRHHHPTTTNIRVCSFCDHAQTGVCTLGVMRNKERVNYRKR